MSGAGRRRAEAEAESVRVSVGVSGSVSGSGLRVAVGVGGLRERERVAAGVRGLRERERAASRVCRSPHTHTLSLTRPATRSYRVTQAEHAHATAHAHAHEFRIVPLAKTGLRRHVPIRQQPAAQFGQQVADQLSWDPWEISQTRSRWCAVERAGRLPKFYLTFPGFEKSSAPRSQLTWTHWRLGMWRLLAAPVRKSPAASAVSQAVEFIKDPYVLEFPGLPETPCETPPHSAIAQEGRAR